MNESDRAVSAPTNGYAIELRGVSHHYGVRPVLRDINLAIWPGQRVVIVGPNGMGKTTLLALMAGVLHPLHGTVTVHGLVRRSSEEAELTIRRQTVYIPDQAFLPKMRTGREWLLGIGRIYEIDIDRLIDHVDRLLRVFDLSHLGDGPVSSYSAGQKRKLALCGGVKCAPSDSASLVCLSVRCRIREIQVYRSPSNPRSLDDHIGKGSVYDCVVCLAPRESAETNSVSASADRPVCHQL